MKYIFLTFKLFSKLSFYEVNYILYLLVLIYVKMTFCLLFFMKKECFLFKCQLLCIFYGLFIYLLQMSNGVSFFNSQNYDAVFYACLVIQLCISLLMIIYFVNNFCAIHVNIYEKYRVFCSYLNVMIIFMTLLF